MADWSRELAVLRRDALRNVVILKYLLPNQEVAEVRQATRGEDAATLLLLPSRVISYDRQHYPEAELSATLIGTSAALARELADAIPHGRNVLFRTASEADRDALAARFTLTRRDAFLSFTGGGEAEAGGGAELAADPLEAPYAVFAKLGHDAAWLAPQLRSGRAFTSVVPEQGAAVAACFAFAIDAGIWEVGGVFTQPSHRGRGLARRAVAAALSELARRGLTPRYQVAEGNTASIALARSLKMQQFQKMTHDSGA